MYDFLKRFPTVKLTVDIEILNNVLLGSLLEVCSAKSALKIILPFNSTKLILIESLYKNTTLVKN